MDERDHAVLTRQLGRSPRGVCSVETRCQVGHPQVIKVYPLLKDVAPPEPFPTLFWLTCPSLVDQISRIEHLGWISRLEQRLEEDHEFCSAYEQNHRSYARERWETLMVEDRTWVEGQGWKDTLCTRGIGGIADWAHIKCLHLHYAHHLARSNVIGAWLAECFELKACA